jgi:CBS domain-containing protein
MKKMRIEDCCRTDVVTAAPGALVHEVAELMRNENVGSVVITENNMPVGIVTDRDIVVRGVARNLDPKTARAREVMTKNPIVITPDADLSDAMQCARREKIRRLPVVDAGGCLVGIVTVDDTICILSRELLNLTEIIREESPRAD